MPRSLEESEIDTASLDGARFWTCLWGYQKHDVDVFVAQVTEAFHELEEALAANEAVVASLRQQHDELATRATFGRSVHSPLSIPRSLAVTVEPRSGAEERQRAGPRSSGDRASVF